MIRSTPHPAGGRFGPARAPIVVEVRNQAVVVPPGFDPAPSLALPWAHLDIAGVADVEKPGGWQTRGCSGFGARLLADFALTF